MGAADQNVRSTIGARLRGERQMQEVQDMVTTTITQDKATQTAVPKDKAIPPQIASAGPSSSVTSEVDRLVDGRFRVQRLQEFAADPSRMEMVVASTPVSEDAISRGVGTSGIFTVVEPPDLALYRSYIPSSLRMPEVPEVALALVDFNGGNPVTRYPEGWVHVKATRPDTGQDLWVVASMPVANVLTAYIGIAWGLPKYVADEITISPNRAEVIYEGAVRFSLELTPGPAQDEPALRTRIGSIRGNGLYLPVLGKDEPVPIHNFSRGTQPQTPEWATGTVKAYLSPDDPWSGLVPANSETPGVFQRMANTGFGETLWQKVGMSAAAK